MKLFSLETRKKYKIVNQSIDVYNFERRSAGKPLAFGETEVSGKSGGLFR